MPYYVTVNIANAGTELKLEGGASTVGHMWFSLDKGDGSVPSSYGFAPEQHGRAFAPGKVYDTDSKNYATTYYTKTIEISKSQYDVMSNFGDVTLKGAADSTIHVTDVAGKDQSFELNYNGLTNSCIDYTLKGLQIGGINPVGLQGGVWPTWNRTFIDNMLTNYEGSIGSKATLFNSDKQIQSWLNQGEVDSQGGLKVEVQHPLSCKVQHKWEPTTRTSLRPIAFRSRPWSKPSSAAGKSVGN
jgi:hypothetical protein